MKLSRLSVVQIFSREKIPIYLRCTFAIVHSIDPFERPERGIFFSFMYNGFSSVILRIVSPITQQRFSGIKWFQGGSCESLSSKGGALTGSDSGVLELSDSGGGGPPGEWDAVPGVVRQCIRHLENTGLRTLGVFRVSPSKKRVRQVSIWKFLTSLLSLCTIELQFLLCTIVRHFLRFPREVEYIETHFLVNTELNKIIVKC